MWIDASLITHQPGPNSSILGRQEDSRTREWLHVAGRGLNAHACKAEHCTSWNTSLCCDNAQNDVWTGGKWVGNISVSAGSGRVGSWVTVCTDLVEAEYESTHIAKGGVTSSEATQTAKGTNNSQMSATSRHFTLHTGPSDGIGGGSTKGLKAKCPAGEQTTVGQV
jgi:hypothetical protein